MPRLSCSQRTTAPAMATEPWNTHTHTQITFLSNLTEELAAVSVSGETSRPPLERSRRVCPGPVCTPRWSTGRGPTSPAAKQEDGCRKRRLHREMSEFTAVRYLGPGVPQEKTAGSVPERQKHVVQLFLNGINNAAYFQRWRETHVFLA